MRYGSFLVAITALFFTVALTTNAQTGPTFSPLVGLPGLQGMSANTSLPNYINALYYLTITIGALIGVIKIAFAGVKYSLSDIVTDKASAKKDIQGVLLGLAILLVPFIVLETIYPNLTELNVLGKVQQINTNVPARTPSTPNITSTQFITQNGNYVSSNTNMGIYSRPLAPVDRTELEKQCKENNPNSSLVETKLKDGILERFGYSCN